MPYDEYDPQNREEGQPEYRPGYSYYSTSRRKPKRHTGLLVVLAVLALLTGLASWAVNVLGVRVDFGQGNAVVSLGQQQTQQQDVAAAEPNTEQPSVNQTQTQPETATPTPEQSVEIVDSPQSVENRPAEDENALSLQAIYDKVIPSVASISCVLQSSSTSSGTGIVMSQDGYIITNYHVIEGAEQIFVLLEDDATYQASLVGGDETTDLAVLKIDATGLTPAEFGNSDALRVGDVVVAIGDPLGIELRSTMTDGIVSAINRDLNLSGRQMTLIQTNAALNSGNSGGPLINCYGQVIGINTMKMSSYSATSATVEGLGFAIPITAAKPILDELISQGYVSGRPAIGIQGQTLDLRTQVFFHMPSGVVITAVEPGSDAEAKGLEPDDVIVGFNDTAISSLEDLVAAKNDLGSGDVVTLTIYRGGRYYEVDITLMDQTTAEIY